MFSVSKRNENLALVVAIYSFALDLNYCMSNIVLQAVVHGIELFWWLTQNLTHALQAMNECLGYVTTNHDNPTL